MKTFFYTHNQHREKGTLGTWEEIQLPRFMGEEENVVAQKKVCMSFVSFIIKKRSSKLGLIENPLSQCLCTKKQKCERKKS